MGLSLRAQLQPIANEFKRREESRVNRLDELRAAYKASPNEALSYCHTLVGRTAFTDELRKHIHRHILPRAFELALDKCLSQPTRRAS